MFTPARAAFHHADARCLSMLPSGSVHLIVTSPPYPMVAMWDHAFSSQDPCIGQALAAGDGTLAWRLMHRILDEIWRECARVLAPGGFACINIGDATRTIGGDFHLFSNHSQVLSCLGQLGLTVLPDVLWRKPTNAPNKFMGSGMLPAGAYVTYEHEYILIFRKGGKRPFTTDEERRRRRSSAFFWEERNSWFSDVWMDVRGTGQHLNDAESRARSAAFPVEIPYRLVAMYSVAGDTVLDPFAGTCTTAVAALALGRNVILVENTLDLLRTGISSTQSSRDFMNGINAERLQRHREWVESRTRTHGAPGHRNTVFGFPVMTSQETDLVLCPVITLTATSSAEMTAAYGAPEDLSAPCVSPNGASDEVKPFRENGTRRKSLQPADRQQCLAL